MALDPISKRVTQLKTPLEVQNYLYDFDYNPSAELQSALTTIRTGRAHCLEGVFVAASILEHHGFDAWCMSFESIDGLDHCLFVFQNQKGLWGSIGKSRDKGLHGRPAQFETLEKLARSYEVPYVDHSGRIKAWQVAHLDEVGCDWRRSTRNVWAFENHLLKIKHHSLKSSDSKFKKIKDRYLKHGPPPPEKHWWYPK
ncbi:MAG: hypothetical protein ACK5V3_02735 [Bdellovibrionales bacterium]